MSELPLTEEQLAVVNTPESCFVEACPGAGKTQTIVELFMRTASNLPPREGIAALSFTNVAADEIRKRCTLAKKPSLAGYPHFVGTFDSFIARYLVVPFGSPFAPGSPVTVVESWQRRGIYVRAAKGVRAEPVSLDAFRRGIDGSYTLDESVVPQTSRVHVRDNESRWLEQAKRDHARWLQRGLMSCNDARVLAAQRLRETKTSRALLRALKSRFTLLIVDEVQDCNELDVEIVDRLDEAGVRTVLIGDPDQSIFEFRGARAALDGPRRKRKSLSMTGNFRSAVDICKVGSSLRATQRTDQPRGDAASTTGRVFVLPYDGRVDADIGKRFARLAEQSGVPIGECAVLAYREDTGRLASGLPILDKKSESSLARIAQAVSHYRADTPQERLRGVEIIEDILLTRLGEGADTIQSRSPTKIGHDATWLRQMSQRILGLLSVGSSEAWLEACRNAFDAVPPPTGRSYQKSVGQLLRSTKVTSAPTANVGALSCVNLTVHRAKGREYDGVLLVLAGKRLDADLDAWRKRADEDVRRVFYVAVTRARRLLVVAVPGKQHGRVKDLLARDGATVTIDAGGQKEAGRARISQVSLFPEMT